MTGDFVDATSSCACGRPVTQPWRARDSVWSPASVVGGLVWVALGVGSVLGGWTMFGVGLLAVLGGLVAGSLVAQAVRGHRGGCWLARGGWFGIAVAGVPLRVAYWLNF